MNALVGIYSRIGVIPDTHAVLFRAEPIGGSLKIQPGETIDVRYFPFDEIPEDLILGQKKRIEDAIKGIGGSVAVVQEMILSGGQKPGQNDINEIRKQPRQARIQLFQEAMKKVKIRVETEVGEEK